jgi:L-seryl-tRNA(Ser) seleniumtransferase
MDKNEENPLRSLPSVAEFMDGAGKELAARFGAGVVKLELRALLEDLRGEIRGGKRAEIPAIQEMVKELERRVIRLTQPIGRRAINATGILLHTGLGRAPLCKEAADAVAGGGNYSVLQASLDSGDRSLREEKLQRMFMELIGCEAMTLVNNNAAATMLILNTLAAGKEVIISRGQLIEIGGSFRMTEVMAQSSAVLREVGTTNRTHLRDYESAINEKTGAIIHVHTSNYRVRGFAGTPGIGELVALGKKHGIPVIDDLGSGAIVPLSEFGISNEPLVKDSLAAGADVVCFSGDKLISGPQSGIICGKKPIIEKIRKNPYARMFRVCKLTLAGLEATLVHFLNGTFREGIPFYRMMSRKVSDLEKDARCMEAGLKGIAGLNVSVGDDLAYVGSGSIPDEGIPAKVLRITHDNLASDELARRLRLGVPSIFGRLQDRTLILDVRTLLPGEIEMVIEAVKCATK